MYSRMVFRVGFGLMVVVMGLLVTATVTMQQSATSRYLYDKNGRLTGVISPTAGGSEATRYEYDPAGNLTAVRRITNRPAVVGFFPPEGVVGDRVTLVGLGFSSQANSNQVAFSNRVTARIVTASPLELVVEVPPGAVTGPLSVTTPEGMATTTEPFYVIPPVQVNPPTITVQPRQNVLFSAEVRLASGDRRVKWSVNGVEGGSSSLGTISPGGLYIAPQFVPPTPIVVRATSVERPTLFGEGRVSAEAITLTPVTQVIKAGDQLQFTAEVKTASGEASLRWSVNGIEGGDPTVGTIAPSGLYTSPTEVSPYFFTTMSIQARSVASPGVMAEARVIVGSLTISPAEAVVRLGEGRSFNAWVNFISRVTWSVNGIEGGNERLGTVTESGGYQAPQALPAEPIRLRATCVELPSLFVEAPIKLGKVDLNPTFVVVRPGQSLTFTAETAGLPANDRLVWSVEDLEGGNDRFGRVSQNGFYVAPATSPARPLRVRAASTAFPDLYRDATVIVASLTLTPTEVNLAPGQLQAFTATVNGLSDQRVVWSVNGVRNGNDVFGRIGSDGGYYAPQIAPVEPVTIRATSLALPDLSAEARVNVLAVRVVPPFASVAVGQTIQFTAAVTPASADQRVTWSVNTAGGGNATVGTITPGGLYTAPAVSPGIVTIRAASVAVPAVTGTAQVAVTGSGQQISVIINPTEATVSLRNTQQFTAVVLPASTNQQVTWSVNGIVGGNAAVGTITANGLYTAPDSVPQSRPGPYSVVPGQGVVVVRATSVASPSAFAEAQVTVFESGGGTRPKR